MIELKGDQAWIHYAVVLNVAMMDSKVAPPEPFLRRSAVPGTHASCQRCAGCGRLLLAHSLVATKSLSTSDALLPFLVCWPCVRSHVSMTAEQVAKFSKHLRQRVIRENSGSKQWH